MELLKIFLFASLTETGKAGCGFLCTNFLFSRLERGFSLYPFPLELGLSVSIPNTSRPWSTQSVLQESSSALYMKTKWPDSQKPMFLSRLPRVDRYCGTLSLFVLACKRPEHKYFNKTRRLSSPQCLALRGAALPYPSADVKQHCLWRDRGLSSSKLLHVTEAKVFMCFLKAAKANSQFS